MDKKKEIVLDSYPTLEAAQAMRDKVAYWLRELSLTPRFSTGIERKRGCFWITLEDSEPNIPLPNDYIGYEIQLELVSWQGKRHYL